MYIYTYENENKTLLFNFNFISMHICLLALYDDDDHILNHTATTNSIIIDVVDHHSHLILVGA